MKRKDEFTRLDRAISLIQAKLELIETEDNGSCHSHKLSALYSLENAQRHLRAGELALELE